MYALRNSLHQPSLERDWLLDIERYVSNLEKFSRLDENYLLEEQAVELQKKETEISCLKDDLKWETEVKNAWKSKYKLLEEEKQELKRIIKETLWMARRYADGRSTYAPEMVNKCIMSAEKLGISLEGPVDEPYAKDGMFGVWNPETERFENEKK